MKKNFYNNNFYLIFQFNNHQPFHLSINVFYRSELYVGKKQ